MELAEIKFTKNDLAKYPFLKETAEYVKKLDLKLEDLADPDFTRVLDRAKERVEEAILYLSVTRKFHNQEIEILSFPVAIMMVVATENSFIRKRYALAEAKRTHIDLQVESNEQILSIAQNFGWSLVKNEYPAIGYEFALYFADYLKCITYLREKKWKLVNRLMIDGYVYLTKNETARLLSEEARRYFETKFEATELYRFPKEIIQIARNMNTLAVQKIGRTKMDGFPKIVVQSAFPPCISTLYTKVTKGHHLSHVGRFTLTSFLVNIGMTPENINEIFKNFSDYNEKMTHYQIEHIAGERGSRTRYIPPRCDTLKSHGVCSNSDELCQKVHHPLAYYQKKQRKKSIKN